jgi:DNA-binding transcriptional regulator YiaG
VNKGKYYPLFEHLRRSRQDQVRLTFAEIEALVGACLPGSARAQRAWWSNRSGRGVLQASAWGEAGYRVAELDLEGEWVAFRKTMGEYKLRRVGGVLLWDGDAVKALRLHMGFNQSQLAKELGVRQQTISEWETGAYAPSRAMSKYLALVAERAGFEYGKADEG